MKGTLKRDILSQMSKGKKRQIYAKKGDTVQIISERGDVLIVETKYEKFTILKEDIHTQ